MFDLNAAERHFLTTADEALPALSTARRATECLAAMVDGASTPPEPDDAPPSFYVREATLVLSVLALRTARACLLVVSAGYMPEAHGLKRRLSEIHARAQAVAQDTTGEHARQWLQNRGPSTPHKIVGKFGSADLWEVYGWGAHADAQSAQQWLTVPMPDVHKNHRGLVVPPHHHQILSNALLTEVGMECRDMAAAMAVARATTHEEVRVNVDQVKTLDPDLETLIDRYYNRVQDDGGEPR